jgi:hypothetical protein
MIEYAPSTHTHLLLEELLGGRRIAASSGGHRHRADVNVAGMK